MCTSLQVNDLNARDSNQILPSLGDCCLHAWLSQGDKFINLCFCTSVVISQ